MKVLTTTALMCFAALANAQNNGAFLKHDTITLKASQCNWLIPPQLKTSAKIIEANTVAEWVLEAIKQGKLKATDPETGAIISADKITTWNAPADTVMVFDTEGETFSYRVMLAEIDPSHLSAIKILQDWYKMLQLENFGKK